MSKSKITKPFIIIAIVILAVALLLLWGRLSRRPEMILFYSTSCPHCQIVEQYIAANGIRAKYQFQELEISGDQGNRNKLVAIAKGCGLDSTQSLSVPLFFDGQKCLLGDEEIINFFKE